MYSIVGWQVFVCCQHLWHTFIPVEHYLPNKSWWSTVCLGWTTGDLFLPPELSLISTSVSVGRVGKHTAGILEFKDPRWVFYGKKNNLEAASLVQMCKHVLLLTEVWRFVCRNNILPLKDKAGIFYIF